MRSECALVHQVVLFLVRVLTGFAVLAAALKEALVGAPVDPGDLILSLDPFWILFFFA